MPQLPLALLLVAAAAAPASRPTPRPPAPATALPSAAAPAPAVPAASDKPEPLSLGLTDFTALRFTEQEARFLGEHLAQQVTVRGVRVFTPREVAAVIGEARRRELAGCADSTACLAEIGNALGVDGLILGDVAKFGQQAQVNLKVLTPDGRLLSTYARRVARESELLDALTEAAARFSAEVPRALGREPTPEALAPVVPTHASAPGGGSSLRRWAWAPAAAGAVAAVGGGLLLRAGAKDADRLTQSAPGSFTRAQADDLRDSGARKQRTGAVLLGAGAAGLAAGGVLYWLGGRETQFALVPRTRGAVLALGGELP